eukprot:CAMPEP_0182431154 /NCGR_PEP_ID=MMETSP1167-20130531/46760_1 /TAXON_ID=2988 /ORGANISM="Mallomonas Sp, Strain CCMP3275" /LENGTH=580 /DNA_ID=CAMNT_0024617151 /DNA_START=44 /DNA_END=1786 /DNA_ORIENTATION=+
MICQVLVEINSNPGTQMWSPVEFGPGYDLPQVACSFQRIETEAPNSASSPHLELNATSLGQISIDIPPLTIGKTHGGASPFRINGEKEQEAAVNSPVSIIDAFGPLISLEAPARLQSYGRVLRKLVRSFSATEVEDTYCRLDTTLPKILAADLPDRVHCADSGLKVGIQPSIAEGCMGGTYFLRDTSKTISVVFKPSDEEPCAPQNPHQGESFMGKHRSAYKGGIFPGFGMFREIAVFTLDNGVSGVPPTHLAKVRHPVFKPTTSIPYKIGSVQSFVRSICTAEDMGPSMFNVEDILRVAILDIRICNLDRHAGNLLVCHDHPYQGAVPCAFPQSSSTDSHSLLPSSGASQLSLSAPSNFGSFMKASRSAPATRHRHRLVPIDHGYCIPHLLHMDEVTFCWTEWAEADSPLSEELRGYVLGLDADADAMHLRKLVGAAISEECLITLWVCTRLLQLGVEAGLSLRAIGSLMLDDYDSNQSPLQTEVMKAVERAAGRSSKRHHFNTPTSIPSNLPKDGLHRSHTVAGKDSLSELRAECANLGIDRIDKLLSAQLNTYNGVQTLRRELESAIRSLLMDSQNR